MEKLDYNSGIYLLELNLAHKKEIKIGAKGLHFFPDGYYYYCGSAQKNLQARINRHLAVDKNFHWHIDYLLAESEISDFNTWPYSQDKECKLAEYIKEELTGNIIVKGFGASDCNCTSHLFHFEAELDAENKEWC